MKNKKGLKGFTLVELVIVIAVIAILASVLLPTFSRIIERAKENTRMMKVTSARDDFLGYDGIDTLSDMQGYLFCVDGEVYEVNQKGDLVLSAYDISTFEEEGSVVKVQMPKDGEFDVTIYRPSAQGAYSRAIKARNDYRRNNSIDQNYYEMANYIITVYDETANKNVNYKVQYSTKDPSVNGSLIEINDTIETLSQKGLEYVLCDGYDLGNVYYGIVYAPTELTKLAYRIMEEEEKASALANASDSVKNSDFMYSVEGNLYSIDNNKVTPCKVDKTFGGGVQLISETNTKLTLTDIMAEGYAKLYTSTISEDLLNLITEANKTIDAYKTIDCYAIHYGYYDLQDIYHNWTEFETLNGGKLTSIQYKELSGVENIKKLILSDNVKTLGYKAFANYVNLEEIIIPEATNSIIANPFANRAIQTIRVNRRNSNFEDIDNKAIVKTGTDKMLVCGTTEILDSNSKLPSEITQIGDYAFESSNLGVIDIIGIEEIGNGVFKNCTNLTSVTHELKEIKDETFSGCSLLQFVSSSEVLETIGVEAFAGCESLAELSIPVSLTQIKLGAFNGCTNKGNGFMLKYASSKKTFENNVTVEADITTIYVEYALKDITYNLNGGELQTQNTVLLNPKSTTELQINAPTNGERYVFVDWSVKGTESQNTYTNVTNVLVQNQYAEDITLTANYKQVVFDINYIVDEVDVTATQELLNHTKEYNTLDTENVTLSQLTKKGYTFDGWYLEETKIGENFIPTGKEGNITLSAKFDLNVYTITYELSGGVLQTENPTSYTVETETFTLNNPVKQGFIFVGWVGSNGQVEQEIVTIEKGSTENRNYTAKFSTAIFTLSYDLNGGELAVENPSKFTTESENITLNQPTKKGYTFTGWSDGINNIGDTFVCSLYSSNIILTATYEANTYTINYVGEKVTNFNNPTTYTYDIDLTLNEPVMVDGYRFTGWTGEFVVDGVLMNAFETTTVTANYKIINFNISYDLVGGNVEKQNPTTYTVESEDITLSNPLIDKRGYTFAGWIGSNGEEPQTTVVIPKGSTGDRTYTQKWIPIVYTISYNLNGGTLENENPTGYTVETETITLNNPTRVGFTFSGWSDSRWSYEIKQIMTIEKDTVGNLEYTAIWSYIHYNIAYSIDVYGNPTSYTIETGTITLNNPSRTGYIFEGWTGSNGGVPQTTVTIEKGSIGDKTYTDNWSIINYNITYNLNGGTLENENPTRYNIETETITLNNPTKVGFTFGGWSDSRWSYETKQIMTIEKGTTGNLEYTAIWSYIHYNITYSIDVYGNISTYCIDTETFTLNNPSRTGYIFEGWTGSNGEVPQTTVTIEKGSIGDKTYIDNWSIITYTLSYNLNGGTLENENPTTYTIETETITLNNPTKTGYTFSGWRETGGYSSSQTVTIEKGSIGNKEYTAYWNVIHYTITISTYVYGNPTSYHIESETITLKNPSKTGYIFEGWTGSNGEVPQTTVTIEKGSIGDKTYTDNWSIITYTLSYNLNGGTLENENPTTYTIETETITLNNPTKTGYTFSGWRETGGYSSSQTVTIEKGSIGNKEYTAYWNVIHYTITISTYVYGNPTSYHIESETITLKNPSKTGYIFEGWTGSNGEVPQTTVTIEKGSIGDKTYTDNWSIINYNITYNLNGGTLENENPTRYNIETETITLNNPTKVGFTFGGWSDSRWSYETKQIMTIEKGTTGNLEYTAIWNYIHYSITYSESVYGNPTSYTIETGTITLNNPSRTGYIFEGWTGSNGDTPQTTVTIEKGSIGDKSYVANWFAIIYTITYNLNGGSLATENPPGFTIETTSFTLTNPTRLGYTFAGWREAGGYSSSQTVTIEKGSTGHREYTAYWSTINYSLSYNLNNGSVSTANPTGYTIETASFTLNNPTRTGFTFEGWTGSNGSTPQTTVTIEKGSTGVKSYTANWSAIVYTITYTLNGGTSSNVTTYTVESAEFTLNAPTRSGATFLGWTGSNGTTNQKSVTIPAGSTGDKNYTAHWYIYSGGTNTGTLQTAKYTTPSGHVAYFAIVWTRTSTATSSTISYTIKYMHNNSSWLALGMVNVKINGTYIYQKTSAKTESYNGEVLKTGTYTISHTAPTTLTFYCGGAVYYLTQITSEGTQSWTLGATV